MKEEDKYADLDAEVEQPRPIKSCLNGPDSSEYQQPQIPVCGLRCRGLAPTTIEKGDLSLFHAIGQPKEPDGGRPETPHRGQLPPKGEFGG